MSEGETPLTDANVAKLTKTPDCFCEADFARDLERKLAEARTAVENIMKQRLATAMASTAREALARIDAGNADVDASPPLTPQDHAKH